MPQISIIVPVYRQWQFVPALLAALAAQRPVFGPASAAGPGPGTEPGALPGTPPVMPPVTGDILSGAVEILLVDNAPGEEACAAQAALAESLSGPLAPGLRRIPCAAPGSYAARNAGAAQAGGQLLVFTDADCRPEPGWLAALWRAFGDTPGQLLAGPVRIALPDAANPWQVFDAVRGIPQELFIAHGYAATANLAVPAAVFRALGGFDARRLSGGDAEFCRRAGAAGYRLGFVPGAGVDHPARDTFAALALKARRIKGGQVGSGPLRRRIFWTLRSLVPPLRECLHYLRAPVSLRHRLTAMRVRFRLWGVELAELARLLSGRARPERR